MGLRQSRSLRRARVCRRLLQQPGPLPGSRARSQRRHPSQNRPLPHRVVRGHEASLRQVPAEPLQHSRPHQNLRVNAPLQRVHRQPPPTRRECQAESGNFYLKKNQLPTTLPITSILSSWHYQLK